MNKAITCCIAMVAMFPKFLIAQLLEFEVSYDLHTSVVYLVDSNDQHKLLAQDTIKLLPTSKIEHFHEEFFSDGTSSTTVSITKPNRTLETWLTPIDEITSNDHKLEIRHNDQLLYSEELVEEQSDLTPPALFASYYLATNNWQLPLTDEEILEFVAHGYEVIQNSPMYLELGCDSIKLVYDKFDWTESTIKFDEAENEYYRQVVSYMPDTHGYLLYNDIITWTIDSRTDPCIQKLVYQHYSNINRIYHNPEIAPSLDNGFSDAAIDVTQQNLISVHQIENTHTVYIDLGLSGIETTSITVRDMYGVPVLQELPFSAAEPYIDLGQLPTGVYSLYIAEENSLPAKFIFRPL